MIRRWKDDTLVTHYVHDNDGPTRVSIEQIGWRAKEALDPGHACQAVERRLNKFTDSHKGIFFGIKSKMLRWLQSLLRTNMSSDERVKLWLNTWRHYKGDHSMCRHDKLKYSNEQKLSDENIEKMKDFLYQTVEYPQKVRPDIDTQANESFNKIKSIYLQKSQKYSTSGEMRICAAISHWNRPDDWKKDLRLKLGIEPLETEYQKILDDERHSYEKQRITKRENKDKLNAKRNQENRKLSDQDRKSSGYSKDGTE